MTQLIAHAVYTCEPRKIVEIFSLVGRTQLHPIDTDAMYTLSEP